MKLNLKDLEKYLFPIKRIFAKYRQIKSVEQVKTFIQEQSAQVTQMTLYAIFGPQIGAQKNLVLFWKWFHNPEYGESRDPNGLYGVLEAFGRAGLPPNPPKT